MARLVLIPILVAALLLAKRMPPKPVAPVTAQGITYAADGDGEHEYVVASNVAGEELWRVKVFSVTILPKKERDVQWVFIKTLKVAGDTLLVSDERSRCYVVDLKTHRVKTRPCSD